MLTVGRSVGRCMYVCAVGDHISCWTVWPRRSIQEVLQPPIPIPITDRRPSTVPLPVPHLPTHHRQPGSVTTKTSLARSNTRPSEQSGVPSRPWWVSLLIVLVSRYLVGCRGCDKRQGNVRAPRRRSGGGDGLIDLLIYDIHVSRRHRRRWIELNWLGKPQYRRIYIRIPSPVPSPASRVLAPTIPYPYRTGVV